MRPVSAAWAEVIAGPHEMVSQVFLLAPDGTSTPLEVVSGSVSLAAMTATRASCDITLNGTDWVPRSATDELAPYVNEFTVNRGIVHPDGTVETVPLGVFGIEDVDVNDEGLETRVTGLDRSARLSKAKFEDFYQLSAGTPFCEAMLSIAQEAWPDVPYHADLPSKSAASITRNVVAQAGDDRWEFIQGLATVLGMVIYFDADGILTLKPYADAGVVAELVEGGTLTQVSRNWSRTNTFNKVIATGENSESGDVYKGVATDDDPLSPTYYGGPFGQCPTFYSSDLIFSDAQAQDAASAKLAQELGTASNVSFGMVPNPALEPEDTVLIRRERAGVDAEHIIDTLTIGLGATEAMSGTTRERLIR